MANNAETPQRRRTLLLTRPEQASARFAAQLDPDVLSGWDVVIAPLLEIVALDVVVDLTGYRGVIFSSAHGVMNAPPGEGRIAYCVGKTTGDTATAMGWSVTLVAPEADALVAGIQKAGESSALLHISGVHQRGDIAARLTQGGIRTDRVEVYDQQLLALGEAGQSVLAGEGVIVLPLFSPRTAAQFAAEAVRTDHVHVIAMSAAVAQEIADRKVASLQFSGAPTGKAMVRAVELALARDSLP